MPIIYVKLRAICPPNGGRIDFFPLKWDHYFIFGFLCLIKPDSDRISTLEPFISQKMGYYTVYEVDRVQAHTNRTQNKHHQDLNTTIADFMEFKETMKSACTD